MHRTLLGLVLASCAFAAPQDTVGERIRSVESALGGPVEEKLKEQSVPGAGVAVIRRGRIDWAAGYGVLEAGSQRRVDEDTLFQAASISKPVTALAALRLVAQGKLSLDEDVNRKLVTWKVPESEFDRSERVTLRRLLSHSAGLSVHGFRGYAPGEPLPTLLQVLDGAKPANSAPIRVTATPGKEWRYSGGGYCVLQQLIEDVTGRQFAEFLAAEVLKPAGMRRSTFAQPLPRELESNAAWGHRAGGKPVEGRWHTYPERAAAGLWTTPSDLARFALAIKAAYDGAPGALLPAALAREMLTVQSGASGLGIGVEGTVFSHGGANEGFRCALVADRESGSGVVAMTNSDNGQVMNRIVEAVRAAYGWGGKAR